MIMAALAGTAASWIKACAASLSVKPRQVEAAAHLLKQDATPPFIVRYRADATGGLDEPQVLEVRRALGEFEALQDRRAVVLKALGQKQGIPASLLDAVRDCESLSELEELYAPYKTKAATLADAARSKGLGPLAERIWADPNVPHDVLRKASGESGILHLLAERVSQSVDGRSALRHFFWEQASLSLSAPKAEPGGDGGKGGGRGGGKGGGARGGKGEGKGGGGAGKGADGAGADLGRLIGSSLRVRGLPAHRTLAINRAEDRKQLKVAVIVPDRERAIGVLCAAALPRPRGGPRAALLQSAASDAYVRLLHPTMAREVRRRLTKEAEVAAARVFASNLASLLMQRPVRDSGSILGIDPGFKSGCKLAVIGECGSVIEHGVMFPHPPMAERQKSKATLMALVAKHSVGIVAIGDGTASQPTIELVAEAIREGGGGGSGGGGKSGGSSGSSSGSSGSSSGSQDAAAGGVRLSVVSEAGASVLSVSAAAKKAEPHLDEYTIGAASLARRLQDPLAELVKIDPKAIGVVCARASGWCGWVGEGGMRGGGSRCVPIAAGAHLLTPRNPHVPITAPPRPLPLSLSLAGHVSA